MVDVIILNGGSSSGKTRIAKCLQDSLPVPRLRFGIDDLIDAMPAAMIDTDRGIRFGSDGSVSPGLEFRALESAWMRGIAAMVRGGRVIVEDVFISGTDARKRWQESLKGLRVLWVGVFCDPAVASEREVRCGDRVAGMAALQATAVHVGQDYDVWVDTMKMSPEECAAIIAQIVNR